VTQVVVAAAVQATPVFLDRDATVEKVVELTEKAAAQGAGLVVFPEAFVPAYPDWVWRTPAWSDRPFYEALAREAVSVPSTATDRMGEAARAAQAWLAVGVNERDPNGGTLYNTLLYFAPDGTLAGLRRKLIPTGGERTIWGHGDGSTLSVLDTAFGRLGGQICWENYMPLARAALYARASTCTSPPPGTPVTAGSRPCATSPKKGGCTRTRARPAGSAGRPRPSPARRGGWSRCPRPCRRRSPSWRGCRTRPRSARR